MHALERSFRTNIPCQNHRMFVKSPTRMKTVSCAKSKFGETFSPMSQISLPGNYPQFHTFWVLLSRRELLAWKLGRPETFERKPEPGQSPMSAPILRPYPIPNFFSKSSFPPGLTNQIFAVSVIAVHLRLVPDLYRTAAQVHRVRSLRVSDLLSIRSIVFHESLVWLTNSAWQFWTPARNELGFRFISGRKQLPGPRPRVRSRIRLFVRSSFLLFSLQHVARVNDVSCCNLVRIPGINSISRAPFGYPLLHASKSSSILTVLRVCGAQFPNFGPNYLGSNLA